MNIGLDFDETLVSSSLALKKSLEELGEILNNPIIFQDNYNSMKLEDILEIAFPFHLRSIAKMKFMELYPVTGIPLIKWKTQALDLLAELKRLNHKLYIISAKQQSNLELALAHIDGRKYFHEIFGGVHGQEKAQYIQDFEIEIYLGDSIQDMKAAELAGVKGIQLTPKRIHDNQIVELLEFLNYVS